MAALRQRLKELGWIEGRNLKVDYRWSEGNIERARAYAAEIVALNPDVIFALANSQLAPLSRETRTTRAFDSAAATLGIEAVNAPIHNINDIEPAIAGLAQTPNTGLVVSPDSFTQAHDKLIVTLAAKHRLPTIYGNRSFPVAGGLMSYGPNFVDTVQRSASYIDRILHGEKPADLAVQQPTKFELVINLNTAKTLGLTISNQMQLLADEVIE